MATIYTFEDIYTFEGTVSHPSVLLGIDGNPVFPKPSLGEGWYQRVDIPLLVQVDAPQVPLPPSSILLVSALLGLAVLKRKGK